MSIYAERTKVPIDRSRAEIESTLKRYGAEAFAYATDSEKVMIQFQAAGRRIRFMLLLPNRNDRAFRAQERWDKACRQRWRALALSIKARLESAASGIDTFEDAFMAHIVLPDGKTVSEHMAPQIESAYKTGKMPALLPHFGS